MIRRLLLSAAAVLALVAAGCSDEGGGAAQTDREVDVSQPSAPDDPGPADDDTSPSSACSPARSAPAGQTTEVLEVDGVERTYLLDVPESYDGEHAVPLIVSLHGSGSDARQQVAYSGLPAAAAEVGAVVATLEGTGSPRGFAISPGSADVAVVTQLLDDLEQRLCIDEDRLASAGISNGSATSAILACALDGRLASVGLVAATVGPFDCPDDVRVSVIAFHGTGDRTVPYEGGDVETARPADALGVRGAEEQIQEWAAQDGCDPDPEVDEVAADVRRWAFTGCEAGTAVDFYRLDGAGHVWPGSSVPFDLLEPRLGPNTDSVVASERIVEFVVEHPRVG